MRNGGEAGLDVPVRSCTCCPRSTQALTSSSFLLCAFSSSLLSPPTFWRFGNSPKCSGSFGELGWTPQSRILNIRSSVLSAHWSQTGPVKEEALPLTAAPSALTHDLIALPRDLVPRQVRGGYLRGFTGLRRLPAPAPLIYL